MRISAIVSPAALATAEAARRAGTRRDALVAAGAVSVATIVAACGDSNSGTPEEEADEGRSERPAHG